MINIDLNFPVANLLYEISVISVKLSTTLMSNNIPYFKTDLD